ncbi:hypothetical protein [Aphanothece sacrum]|uniref:Uncharacterized protein n=1 Tax=Aphanothece sacrum FPU1 TaxID=1920663 RepID=A0A401IF11_APHSA|nr:hypothetical protein [Aphanothece sacrum]GBF79824.1 hypothetical protein AsFPU1_1224 [Aphanothece sacrum FPU1]GBF84836.1 hypothetical protein AsFPU3_1891 [Aphanothece sacrum FPU3]
MNEDRLARIEKIVESNAKSIQALSDAVAQDRKEWARDRHHIFDWMSRLAAAQRDFYEVQSDYIRHIETIEDRLATILERFSPEEKEDQT